MEKHVVKVLDATIISSFLHDIASTDMFERCDKLYELVTTTDVSEEIKMRPASKHGPKKKTRLVSSYLLDGKERELLDYLSTRYPGLHIGELSTLVLAASRYASSGKKCYFITDDNLMRKSIEKIKTDPIFQNYVGNVSISCTGTIGLLLHLCEKGTIDHQERIKIADDIENSTFYCPMELLKRLRG